VAAELAAATANLGAQVIAVDLDRQSPALSRRLCVERAPVGWRALLDREIQNLDLALTRTSVRNLQLLTPGAPRAGEPPDQALTLDAAQRRLLIQQLRAQEVDVVILDLGPQSPEALADFFALAELGLAVTSHERAALATWLAFLARGARRPAQAATEGGRARGFRARLVGNQARAAEDFEAIHAFSRLVHAELSIDLPVIGCVRMQERLSAVEGAPPASAQPRTFDGNAQTFLRMGELLLHENGAPAGDRPAGGDAESAPDRPDPPSSLERREIAQAQELLSIHLDRHRRKKLRVEVDWAATLVVGTRRIAVRVVDVSLSGAALEIASALAPGTRATLILDQLRDQPDIAVMVKSQRPEIGRAGVAFIGAETLRRTLLATAEDQRSPAAEGDEGDNEFEEEVPTQPLRAPGSTG